MVNCDGEISWLIALWFTFRKKDNLLQFSSEFTLFREFVFLLGIGQQKVGKIVDIYFAGRSYIF